MTTLAYTFGTGLTAVVLVVWVLIWLFVAVSIVRRRNLGVGGKVIWIVVILVIPIFGLLAFFLWDAARPPQTRRHR